MAENLWREDKIILMLSKVGSSSILPLTPGKKTHVYLSHDWGIDGNNHHRVKQVNEALKSRGLVTWIDDERFVGEMDNEIIDGIDCTECMLVFLTENYASKLDSQRSQEYIRMEFKYAFNILGRDRMIMVVLDKAMLDPRNWGRTLRFHLESALYFNLSGIFDVSSTVTSLNDAIDSLYNRIIKTIGLNEFKGINQEKAQVVSIQQLVRWNRGKIMLVGQGRAGKTALANNLTGIWIPDTPSTLGAEQFDVKMFYGGVNGGMLKLFDLPESQLESFLAQPFVHESLLPRPQNSQPDPVVSGILDSKQQLHESFKLNPRDINQEKVLHYQEVQDMEIPSKYKLTLIDFGGQSVFNVLHAFFMSKYSIYLVVFDMALFLSPDQDKKSSCLKELNFWLNTIALHAFDSETGETAPVAIVGTRGDIITSKNAYHIISDTIKHLFERKSIWDNLLWYEEKSARYCFFPNSNTLTEDNPVREQLLLNIEQRFDASEFMKKEIPLVWIKIFDEMKSFNQSYLSYSKLIEIVSEMLSNQSIEISRVLLFLNRCSAS